MGKSHKLYEDKSKAILSSWKEMAHILGFKGLGDPENEAWYLKKANASCRERYSRLTPIYHHKLNLCVINAENADQIPRFIFAVKNLETYQYMGFHGRWPGHVYSFNLIKYESTTKIFYVNRSFSQLMQGSFYGDHTVVVLSISNNDVAGFLYQLLDVISQENRRKLCNFLLRHQDKIDVASSERFEKSEQKTGNCTIANSNVAWMFALMSHYMRELHQDEPTWVETEIEEKSHKKALSVYKKMREADRTVGVKYFLENISHQPEKIITKLVDGKKVFTQILKNPAIITGLDLNEHIKLIYLLAKCPPAIIPYTKKYNVLQLIVKHVENNPQYTHMPHLHSIFQEKMEYIEMKKMNIKHEFFAAYWACICNNEKALYDYLENLIMVCGKPEVGHHLFSEKKGNTGVDTSSMHWLMLTLCEVTYFGKTIRGMLDIKETSSRTQWCDSLKKKITDIHKKVTHESIPTTYWDKFLKQSV